MEPLPSPLDPTIYDYVAPLLILPDDTKHRDFPQCRLWDAVLRDALACYTRRATVEIISTTDAEAAYWIESNSQDVGSFRFVCDILSLDYRSVRRLAKEKRGHR